MIYKVINNCNYNYLSECHSEIIIIIVDFIGSNEINKCSSTVLSTSTQ